MTAIRMSATPRVFRSLNDKARQLRARDRTEVGAEINLKGGNSEGLDLRESIMGGAGRASGCNLLIFYVRGGMRSIDGKDCGSIAGGSPTQRLRPERLAE